MIENILIVDTETTGFEPTKGAQIIEIAVILFNLRFKTVLQQFSSLFPCETNPVEHINGIKAESTKEKYSNGSLDSVLKVMLDNSDACVAHNACFDKKFVATLSIGNEFMNKKWICTKDNFKWPRYLNRYRLQDICNVMGVDYLNAHRALNDCRLLVQCFEKVEDLEERFNSLIST